MADLPLVTTNDAHPQAHNEERAEINLLNQKLASKITAPSGAATGDLLRWDGTQWLTTETRFFEGTGSPNGVVAAPIGSRYVDKTGTRGAVDWVKTSGGGSNTGWTSSIGALAFNGESGTSVVGGIAAKTKTRSVALNSDIFLGATPRQVVLTAVNPGADIAHPYLISKGPNTFSFGVRHIDNLLFTAAANYTVDWIAIL